MFTNCTLIAVKYCKTGFQLELSVLQITCRFLDMFTGNILSFEDIASTTGSIQTTVLVQMCLIVSF
jgi:hypothetical protein